MNESDNISPPLDASRIEHVCAARGFDVEAHVLSSVDSTNTWLLRKKFDAPFVVCAAEHQTVGRGRRGKVWHSPSSGVTFSVRLNCLEPIGYFNGLSLLVGALLCDQLRDVGVTAALVKWPNDILVGEAKLAGILIESVTGKDFPTTIVIGIGINYKQGKEASLIDQVSIDMFELCGEQLIDRSVLIAETTARVLTMLANDVPEALTTLASSWQDYDALAGRKITVQSPAGSSAQELSGVAAGIDACGALQLATPVGVKVFNTAEITILRS